MFPVSSASVADTADSSLPAELIPSEPSKKDPNSVTELVPRNVVATIESGAPPGRGVSD
jgi:hypothetical protein